MSVAFAAGANARSRIIKELMEIYGNISPETLVKVMNRKANTALHVDERDIGLGGKHLSEQPYIDSGIELLGCKERVL